jgi:glyoxylase I family protein
MIKGLHHAAVHVSDIEKALDFYTNVLGFKVVWAMDAGGDFLQNLTQIPGASLHAALLDCGDTGYWNKNTVEMIQMVTPAPRDLGNTFADIKSSHVAFYVEDPEGTYEELKAKGVKFNPPPQVVEGGPIDGTTVIYFTDPDGNTLELFGKSSTRK